MHLIELKTAGTEYNEFLGRGGVWSVILKGADALIFRPLQYVFPAVAGTLVMVFVVNNDNHVASTAVVEV